MNNVIQSLVSKLVTTNNINNIFGANYSNPKWQSPSEKQKEQLDTIYEQILKAQQEHKKFWQQTTTENKLTSKRKKRQIENKIIPTTVTAITKNTTEIVNDLTGLTSIVITAKNSFISSGIMLDNKIYIAARDGSLYEYNLITRQQKVVITNKNNFSNSGTIFNNKLYISTFDGKLYEYDPRTAQNKIIINTNKYLTSTETIANYYFKSPGIILNKKLYICANDGTLYQYDPATQQHKIIININSNFTHLGKILKNKLYITSNDGKLYYYDPITNQHKIIISTNSTFQHPPIILNNKFYINTNDGSLYEYNPKTQQHKIIIKNNTNFISSGIILKNKLYISSHDGKLYCYDPATQQHKIIISTSDYFTSLAKKVDNYFSSSGIIFDDKLYISSRDGKLYCYDPATQQHKIIMNINTDFTHLGTILNNKLYFTSRDGKLYCYDPRTAQNKIIMNIDNYFISSGKILNNKLYINDSDGILYEYDPTTQQHKIIINDPSGFPHNPIIFKGKIFISSYAGDLYEYDTFEEVESKIINITALIRRGLYLYYKHNKSNITIKNIMNINSNKLKIHNITFDKDYKRVLTIKSRNPANICPGVRGELINKSENPQELYSAACETTMTTTYSTEKLNGFTFSASNATDLTSNWNVKVNVGAKTTGEVGIPFMAGGKLETSIDIETEGGETTSKTVGEEQTKSRSKTKTKTSTKEIKIQYPSQKITVPPKSKVKVFVIGEKIKEEINMKFTQKITGNITADIVDSTNKIKAISLPIKEIMNSLQQHNILSSKITINNDSSINLIFDTKITVEDITSHVMIDKFINLTEKRTKETYNCQKMINYCQPTNKTENQDPNFNVDKINQNTTILPTSLTATEPTSRPKSPTY